MRVRGCIGRARRRSRGAAAMLFAFLLPVFVGFAALAIDTGVIATARSQLSTAADAAALAGAQQLANEYRVRGVTDMTAQIASANAQAASFASANRVLGQGALLYQNTANSTQGDIVVGYLDPADPAAAMVTSNSSASLFNAVQVRAARNFDHGGKVPTFFGGLMGFNGSNVTVQSTAMAWNYAVAGFRSKNSLSADLLPIVLDQSTYTKMVSKQTTDSYTYNPGTNTVTSGADGVYESVLYPVSAGLPGNWGTIKVGVSNNSTATLGAQIRYGITPDQLATFPGGVIQLDTTLSPPSITFEGNPGISAGIKDDLISIIGKPVTIPIYDQAGGNGNNAWYRVVDFAPCRIVAVNFKGNPKYVVIQPALLNDPTVIIGGPQTSWSKGGQVVLHLVK